VDCRVLADALASAPDPRTAFAAYENRRRPETTRVVLMNRQNPPDAILREVYLRTGDKPFDDINEVISPAELHRLSENYQRVTGYHHENLI
jgi:2-polyprenyl-6-methoxyphenol hydroxylase-like FAD-dependent oxidoreductase